MRCIVRLLVSAWLLVAGAGLIQIGLIQAGMAQDQSLGDVARDQRQKQQTQPKDAKPAPKKVFTNEDVNSLHDPADDETPAPANSKEDTREARGRANASQSAEQWKSTIQREKNTIVSMQKQMDDLNASVHYVEANRYWGGVQYNERQAQKQEQVERMRGRIDQEKQRLEEMQEGARREGYGSAVYDP